MLNKLSIGTAQFGMDYGINNKVGEVDQNEIKRILDFAYVNNIKSLDTARSYGESESKIGRYIKDSNYKWNVTTKISELNSSIEEQLLDTRNKLGCQPSSLLAHSSEVFFNKIFQDQAKDLKNKEMIKNIGLSIYTNEDMDIIIKNSDIIDVIQVPINILDTNLIKNGFLDKLYKLGIKIHARSIFLQGVLSMPRSEVISRFHILDKPLRMLDEFILDENINLAELSLLFVINLDFVSKVVIGIETLDQLKKNVNTLSKKIDSKIFSDILTVKFNDKSVLNPALWN